MPYIEQKNRPPIDLLLQPLADYLKNLPENEQDGSLNYAVTKLLHEIYPLRYRHINRAMGVLSCIEKEYYRKVAAPYEDTKIQQNGEVV